MLVLRALALLLVLAAFPVSAAAAPIVLVDPDGTNARVADDPALPGSTEPLATGGTERPAAAARAASTLSVPDAIARLRKRGQLDAATANQYRKDWSSSVGVAAGLSGTARAEMRAVLENTRRFAADKILTASRLPAVMLTVTRNRSWWSGGSSLSSGNRVRFRDSEIIWQYYPGQGIQIQWLGTFGRANALWSYKGKDDELSALLSEARSLAANRAGGIAFEYLFFFGGGRPPWVSGLAQGTGLTAFSRGGARLRDPALFDDARDALGIFRTAPPRGVRLKDPPGVHYLQYSYARNERIGNGFVQSLNGLHDLALFGNDDEAWKLLTDGERHLRSELPRFDTGAWSRYEHYGARPGPESTLDYHKLFGQFLRGFCDRLTKDRELVSAKAAQAQAGDDPVTTPDAKGRSRLAGKTNPAPYCSAADRFDRYLTEAPDVSVRGRNLRAKARGSVRVRLSKISNVSITVSEKGQRIASRSGLLARGSHRVDVRPRTDDKLAVTVIATDLAGNRTQRTVSVTVGPPPR